MLRSRSRVNVLLWTLLTLYASSILPGQQLGQRVTNTTWNRPQPPVVPRTSQEVLLLFADASAQNRTILTLNNNHTSPLDVTAVLYTISGREITLPTFHLIAKESRLVELEPILRDLPIGGERLGWLKLNYTGVFLGLGAQLTLYDGANESGVDSPRSLSADFKSGQRSAAFWMPKDSTAKLSLTNSSAGLLNAKVRCGLIQQVVALSPHQTFVTRFSIPDILDALLPQEGAAYCDVESDGDPTALRVVGTVRNDVGYAAPMRFYDPQTATFPSLSAVEVDTSAVTHVVVHNLSDRPLLYTPVVREATLDKPKEAIVPQRVVVPGGLALVDISAALDDLRGKGVSQVTVTLNTDAAQGAFVGSLTQEFRDKGLIEDIPLRTANRAGNAAGAYPLRWDKDYTNLVTVTNTSAETLIAKSVITVGDVSYMPAPQTIPPGRSAVYDVDKLRRDQVRDTNGVTLPLNAVYGKFMWFDSSLGSKKGLMGRNSVTSVIDHRKSSFSCGMGCDYTFDTKPYFNMSPFGFGSYGNSGWGSTIVERTSLNNGQIATSPYPFSSTQLSSSNAEVLTYSVDPTSTTSYIASLGTAGSVIASYYEYDSQADTDMFGDCSPDNSEGPVSGGAGVEPVVNITTDAGSDEFISTNGSVQLTAVGQPSGGTYSWTASSSAVTLSNATSSTVTVNGASAGDALVTVTYTSNGQQDTDDKTVHISMDNSSWPADPCDVSASPKSGYTALVSTGTGGSGTIAVSFSGVAYSAVSQTVSYGPYSTPSSIAANIAALITANYTRYGLTARAVGPNVVYSGKSAIGTVSHAITGSSITTTTSSSAEASVKMACEAAPPTPPPTCGAVNPQFVLAVLHDSVTWRDQNMNHGRFIEYSLEYYPTSPNALGAPVTFPSTVTEHLTNPMSFGLSTSGTPNSGQFNDVLGNIGAYNSGVYTADRCFTVMAPSLGSSPIHVMSYDAAGKHSLDHIRITLPSGPSILNNWTNPDGSPKDISIP